MLGLFDEVGALEAEQNDDDLIPRFGVITVRFCKSSFSIIFLPRLAHLRVIHHNFRTKYCFNMFSWAFAEKVA